MQGESNSLSFYEKLAKANGVTEYEKSHIEGLLEGKKAGFEKLSGLHKHMASGEFLPTKVETPDVPDFRAGVRFALMEEARLLREISGIYPSLKEPQHLQFFNSLLCSKVADIAGLMTM